MVCKVRVTQVCVLCAVWLQEPDIKKTYPSRAV